jgi:hypothetical protein
MASRTDRRLYLVAAAFIAAVTSAYAAWRYTNGVVMSDEVGSTYNLVMALLVVTWVVADPKIPPAHRPSFDHAALVWASFPFLAGYHLFAAHRWRGILIVLGLMALLAAPSLVLAIIYAFG